MNEDQLKKMDQKSIPLIKTEDELDFKILEAYRSRTVHEYYCELVVGTLGGLLGFKGIVENNTGMAVSGCTLLGSTLMYDALQYVKAYMEAKLDYLKNKKFTKLQE